MRIADEAYVNQAEKRKAKRRLYVCRAIHGNSIWVAGTQKDKENVCTVTIHGLVQSYEKYELLENIDGAARIAWVHWDKFMQPLLGAVYFDKMLVARYEVPKDKKEPRYTHYIGTLSLNDNFGGTIIFVNEVSNNNEICSYEKSERERERARLQFLLACV